MTFLSIPAFCPSPPLPKKPERSKLRGIRPVASEERVDHRTLEAQGIPRAPLPYLPLPVVTGKFREVSAELTGRLNQWNAVRFRKLALQILNTLRGGELVTSGVRAALEEEAARNPAYSGGGNYVPQC
jgi:hypothetical protein